MKSEEEMFREIRALEAQGKTVVQVVTHRLVGYFVAPPRKIPKASAP